MSTSVRTGLDELVAENFQLLRGQRVAVVANQASVDSQLRHIVDLMRSKSDFSLIRIFAPEHGLRGSLQDMEEVKTVTDKVSGLPVISLYGNSEASLKPSAEMLEGIDTVVFDLQDVGSRYYTFTQTLAYLMQAAGKQGVKVVVLDRPNPIGGEQIEGAPLLAGCRSFCGLFPVANRHGLTVGEIASLIFNGFGEGDDAWPATSCDLVVIPMTGWKRSMYFDDTGLPWVLPSPNMPTLETAIVYPGTCLFEATTLSEGRGTTRPFEFVGAPFIDSSDWIAEIERAGVGLNGCVLRPHSFIPKFQKAHDRHCGGLQIHVTDRKLFQPFRLGLNLIAAAHSVAGNDFSWRSTTYEFVDSVPAIDLLYGSNAFRKCVETKKPVCSLLPTLEQFEKQYLAAREPFLLYE